MWPITLFSVGFSIVVASVLLVSYVFFMKHAPRSKQALLSCSVLLIGLTCLQWGHYVFLTKGVELLDQRAYRFLLFVVPPTFYFFSRSILQPKASMRWFDLAHYAPVGFIFFLPRQIAVPLAFLIGVGYCSWLCHIVYRLRSHRKRFAVELFFYGLFTVLAIVVLVLGFLSTYINSAFFYYFYANGIAVTYMLVLGSLLVYPDLLTDLEEVGTLSYSTSTLENIDAKDIRSRLESLMNQDKFYQNEQVNLSSVSHAIGLSSHQLSEFVNVEYGMGFSRYIRLKRVDAAKEALLLDEDASILSISMELGFKSQSTFYAAFKDLTGKSPGQFRKDAYIS